jgi:hypothetical protein
MYRKSFFRKASLISVIVAIAVIASVMSGCQKEDDEPLDENISYYNYTDYRFNGRPISWIAHTHSAGSNGPCASAADKTSAAGTPGLTRYIYNQGGFYDYSHCDE